VKLLIKGGRVVDPANQVDEALDILVEGDKITRIEKGISCQVDKIIDAADKIVIPGLVDLHAHLREPGREDKETVLSASRAALKGGVTTILAMPNTSPAMDSPANVSLLREIIRRDARANVLICGAITRGRLGKELTDIAALKKAGISALSDDGSAVDDEKLLLEVLKKAKEEKILVTGHCEDRVLSNNGVVNLGFTSTRLGLRGISNESEYKRIERDINLAEKANAPLHIAHVSAKESLKIIAGAKARGVKITCEACPHHFSLSEEDVLDYDTNKKMNPPLRGKEDTEAVRQGLKDGVIDAIASDHAPHTENEKDIEFERAEFGVIGLETLLAVSITELISSGRLDWPALVRKVSLNPAKILGLNRGTLGAGSIADIVVVDPGKEWTVEKGGFVSKSRNSAFLGRKLKGVIEYTLCNGIITYPF